jgi:hypothetical protein
MKKLILLITLLFSTVAYTQIRLPEKFKIKTKEIRVGNMFTDGKYTFNSYPYAHDGFELDDVIANVDRFFNKKPAKTKDNLYIWTGKSGDTYYYTILLPESLFEFQVSSKKNDEMFSYYSIWLLEQIREKRKLPSEYIDGNLYFTDYYGN